jgi:UDP-N-acetylglucosamine/UDP-N-acetylgalactosamine diphosphorylase
VFSVAFLKQEASASLPLHVAHKKVPFLDETGALVEPSAPNAYKFEKFIFDVLPDASVAVNVEFAREEEFSPVKNAEGNDSPETTRRDMMLKAARQLEACGVSVPRDSDGLPIYKVEIDPCFALGIEDLAEKLVEGFTVTADLFLCGEECAE